MRNKIPEIWPIPVRREEVENVDHGSTFTNDIKRLRSESHQIVSMWNHSSCIFMGMVYAIFEIPRTYSTMGKRKLYQGYFIYVFIHIKSSIGNFLTWNGSITYFKIRSPTPCLLSDIPSGAVHSLRLSIVHIMVDIRMMEIFIFLLEVWLWRYRLHESSKSLFVIIMDILTSACSNAELGAEIR